MSMENLMNLSQDVAKNQRADAEAISDNVFSDDTELTEEEKAYLEEVKKETAVVVTDEDEYGNKKDITIKEYTRDLDKKIASISSENDKVLKMLNSGDIVQTTAKMKEEARSKALAAFRTISVTKEELSDDDYMDINDSALEALSAHFGLDWKQSDQIIAKLQKMSLKEILDILPEKFTQIYTTEAEVKANNLKAKERLIASLSYLAVTGPELDYLNDYIDEENKLALVSKRLLQCQVDFMEMIKDPTNLSEIVEKSVAICPMDETFWAKYIKIPNRVHNEFAQRVVIQEKYKEAYTALIEEYPVISLADYLDKPEELADKAKEAAFNEKARALIQEEIDEATNKIDVYSKVMEMELFKSLWPNIVERFGPNSKQKKLSMDYFLKEAVAAVERVRRCKLNLPFPGFKGDEKKPEQIFQHYAASFAAMLENYNKAIDDVISKEENPDTSIEAIHIEGYTDSLVHMTFSIFLAILMGRIVKKLDSNTATKYDMIQLDAYFQIFCRMGMDIYVMEEIWDMMKPLITHVVEKYGTQYEVKK